MPDERRYKSLLTTVGLNLITAAVDGGGKVNITHVAVGDGGGAYYVPTRDMTALRGEKWRGSIAGQWINEKSPNMIDVKVIIPADVGGFTIREAALFDGDGNMVVISNIPDVEKAIIDNGATGTLTIVIHVLVTNSEVLEFKIDPMLDVMTQADFDREIKRHNKEKGAHSEQIAAAVSEQINQRTAEGGIATEEKVAEIVTEELAKRPNGGYIGTYSLTLRADAWKEAAVPVSGCQFVCDVEVAGVKSDHVPVGACDTAYSDTADKAGLHNVCETFDGYIRFAARRRPEGSIAVWVTLFGPGNGAEGGGYVLPVATASTLGGIKLGAGMDAEADGTVHVTGAAVDDETIATDEEVTEMINGVFA